MSGSKHWTQANIDSYLFKVAFDYVSQLERIMEERRWNQKTLADHLKVTEGRVSQVLNNPARLTFRSMAKWARALGQDMSVVVYDDRGKLGTPGPILPDVFYECWDFMGRPENLGELFDAVEAKDTPICRSCTYSDRAEQVTEWDQPDLLGEDEEDQALVA